MPGNTVQGLVSPMLLAGACCTVITALGAGIEAVPAPHGPQIMLYISQPLWSSGGSQPRFGLRIERLRMPPVSPQPAGMTAIQHTSLIDLQMQSHSDVRVEFGRRVVWDIRRGTLGSQAMADESVIGMPIKGKKLPDALGQQDVFAGGPVRRQLGGGSTSAHWPQIARWPAGERYIH